MEYVLIIVYVYAETSEDAFSILDSKHRLSKL